MNPRTGKIIRRTGITIIAMLLLLIAVLAWLLGTRSGARFVLDQTVQRVPGRLAIDSVDGTLLSGLSLGLARYTGNGVDVRIERLDVSVAPSVLFNFRELKVRQLVVSGVVIERTVAPGPAEPPTDIILPVLPSVSTPITVNVEDLQLRDVSIVSLIADGDASTTRIDTLTLAGRWHANTIEFAALTLGTEQGGLSARGALSLTPSLPMALTIDWWSSADSSTSAAGQLSVSGDRDRLIVTHRLDTPFAVRTEGQLRAPTDTPLSVDLRSSMEQGVTTVDNRTVTLSDAVIETRGQLGDWQVTARSALSMPSFESLSLSLSASGDLEQARITDAILRSEDGAQLTASGVFQLANGGAFDGQVQAIRLPLNLFQPTVDGVLNTQLLLRLDRADGVVVGADIASLSGTLNGREFAGKGGVRWSSDTLTIDAIELDVGDNTLRTRGTLSAARALDLTIAIEAPDLDAFALDLEGDIDLEASVHGTLDEPLITATLSADAMGWQAYTLRDARAEIATSAGRVDGTLSATQLSNEAQVVDRLELALNGDVGAHELAVSGKLNDLHDISIAVAGGWIGERWGGEVQRLAATLRQPGALVQPVVLALEAPVAVAIERQRISAAPFCIVADMGASLCANGRIESGTMAIDATLRELRLTDYLPAMRGELRWRGDVDAEVHLHGSVDAPSGRGAITLTNVAVARHRLAESDAMQGSEIDEIKIHDAGAQFNLDAGVLKATAAASLGNDAALRGQLDADNIMNADTPFSARLIGSSNQLSALNAITDAAQFGDGRFTLDASLTGTRSSPAVTVDFDANVDEARVAALGIVLSDIVVKARSREENSVRFSVDGRSGEGKFALAGDAAMDADRGPFVTAAINANDFRFIDLPDLSADATLDLDLDADSKRYSLGGGLTIDRADITVRGLPTGAVRESQDTAVYDEGGTRIVREQDGALSGALDLSINLSERVTLSGFGLNTKLAGALRLTQKPGGEPQGVGTLRLEEATYVAYGQTLEVSRGRLVFNGPLDSPQLDIRAQRSIEEQVVGIDVAGTPEQLSSELFSTPALPDAEAFSLLLTGRNLASAGQDEGSTLSDAALTLGLRQAFGISSSIRDAVGLDTLTVAGSGRGGRLLAGKALSPNLYLQYAYGVFDQLSTVMLRLKLNDRLSLESSSGETQSVDLIYSVGRDD